MGVNRNQEYISAFAKHFSEIRTKSGFSREKLALEADLDDTLVYRIEKGLSNPTLSTLYALAKALKINPKTLLDFDFKDPD